MKVNEITNKDLQTCQLNIKFKVRHLSVGVRNKSIAVSWRFLFAAKILKKKKKKKEQKRTS